MKIVKKLPPEIEKIFLEKEKKYIINYSKNKIIKNWHLLPLVYNKKKYINKYYLEKKCREICKKNFYIKKIDRPSALISCYTKKIINENQLKDDIFYLYFECKKDMMMFILKESL